MRSSWGIGFSALLVACGVDVVVDTAGGEPPPSTEPTNPPGTGGWGGGGGGGGGGGDADADADADADTDTDTDTDTDVSTAVEPVFGTWTLDALRLTSDPCDLASQIELPSAGAPVDLTDLGSAAFTIDLEFDGAQQTELCDLDPVSGVYACDPRYDEDTTAADWGIDAIVGIDIDSGGVFHDSTSTLFETVLDADCYGNGCSTLEFLIGVSFPCQVDVEIDASIAN